MGNYKTVAGSMYRLCGELRVQIGADFSALEDEEGGAMIEHFEALRNDLSSVRYARHRVNELLDTQDSDLRDSAMLLVSEVVTNALIHTNGEVTLHVKTKPGWLRVEVGDSSTRAPKVKTPHQSAVSGRGLELVDALSRNWGVNSHRNGKSVWFELESILAKITRDQLRETSTVVLKNAPAKLVAATVEHSDQALRELLVHSGDDAIDVDAFAEVSEIELNELADQARQALSRGINHLDLVLELPAAAAETAKALLTRLEEADEQCERGELLSPSASDEIKTCRTWLLTEISSQLGASVPQPRRSVNEELQTSERNRLERDYAN